MRIWNFICGWQRTTRSRCELDGCSLGIRILNYSTGTVLAAWVATAFSTSHAAENEELDSTPDLEFLEFLGQFETDTGEWMAPDSLLGEEIFELLDAAVNTETDEDSTQSDDATND